MKTWDCKIGEVDERLVPQGGDAPMRAAVREAFRNLTGVEPAFIFSGWGAELDANERAAVNRQAAIMPELRETDPSVPDPAPLQAMRPMPQIGRMPDGEPVYFAPEGEFDNPGFHVWDGTTHIRYTPATTEAHTALRIAIENEINRHSAENGSDTPDHILARFLIDCLGAFDTAVVAREKFYGRPAGRGAAVNGPAPVAMPEDGVAATLALDTDKEFTAPGNGPGKPAPTSELDRDFPVVGEVKITGGDKSEEPLPFAEDPTPRRPAHATRLQAAGFRLTEP